MAAIIRRSLNPLPGLASAALIVFRWAAILAMLLALTAHLPFFSIHAIKSWINEVSFSFMACVCAFEITLLVMLISQLRRLGMFLRSRPIGLAFGLAVLGTVNLIQALTYTLSPSVLMTVNLLGEAADFLVPAMWIFYIVRPEPKRLPHSLSPASKLMKWNEIALKLELTGKQAEHQPFISGVESTVDAVLERFKGRAS